MKGLGQKRGLGQVLAMCLVPYMLVTPSLLLAFFVLANSCSEFFFSRGVGESICEDRVFQILHGLEVYSFFPVY